MLNVKPSIVENLLTLGYPVVAEMFLTQDIDIPCISYSLENDVQDLTGDTLGYSNVYYTIKIWGKRIADVEPIAINVDELMRSLGFRRVGTNEMVYEDVFNKTIRYRALGLELFE